MSFSVVFLNSAWDDLEAIFKYIARDNLTRADQWTGMLIDKAEALADFPFIAPIYKENYRVQVVKNGYKIYYRVNETKKVVTIVHFFSPYETTR